MSNGGSVVPRLASRRIFVSEASVPVFVMTDGIVLHRGSIGGSIMLLLLSAKSRVTTEEPFARTGSDQNVQWRISCPEEL